MYYILSRPRCERIHYCIGAPLARLEAKIALELFAQRLPGLRLVPDQRIEYVPTVSFRGPKRVRTRLGPNADRRGITRGMAAQRQKTIGL